VGSENATELYTTLLSIVLPKFTPIANQPPANEESQKKGTCFETAIMGRVSPSYLVSNSEMNAHASRKLGRRSEDWYNRFEGKSPSDGKAPEINSDRNVGTAKVSGVYPQPSVDAKPAPAPAAPADWVEGYRMEPKILGSFRDALHRGTESHLGSPLWEQDPFTLVGCEENVITRVLVAIRDDKLRSNRRLLNIDELEKELAKLPGVCLIQADLGKGAYQSIEEQIHLLRHAEILISTHSGTSALGAVALRRQRTLIELASGTGDFQRWALDIASLNGVRSIAIRTQPSSVLPSQGEEEENEEDEGDGTEEGGTKKKGVGVTVPIEKVLHAVREASTMYNKGGSIPFAQVPPVPASAASTESTREHFIALKRAFDEGLLDADEFRQASQG